MSYRRDNIKTLHRRWYGAVFCGVSAESLHYTYISCICCTQSNLPPQRAVNDLMQYRQVCGSAPTRSQLRGVIGLTVSHIRHDFFSHPATVKYVSITWKAPNMSKKRVLGKLSKISFGTFAFHPNVWHHLPRDSQKSRPVMCDKLEKNKKNN